MGVGTDQWIAVMRNVQDGKATDCMIKSFMERYAYQKEQSGEKNEEE